MRVAPLLAAAAAIPVVLALAWVARDVPPAWPCFTDRPAGQAEAIADWRAGLRPAFIAAVVLLGGLAARLSADRRCACGAPGRPGAPTLVAGAAVAATAAVVSAADTGLDELAGWFFVLFLISPVVVLIALSALAWIVWTPVGVKGAAAAQIGIWVCVAVTFLVAAAISSVGLQDWCLD